MTSAIKVSNMSYKYSQQINSNYNKFKKTSNMHMLPPINTDKDRPMTVSNTLPHNREKTINTRKRMATSVHLARGAIPKVINPLNQTEQGIELDITGSEFGMVNKNMNMNMKVQSGN